MNINWNLMNKRIQAVIYYILWVLSFIPWWWKNTSHKVTSFHENLLHVNRLPYLYLSVISTLFHTIIEYSVHENWKIICLYTQIQINKGFNLHRKQFIFFMLKNKWIFHYCQVSLLRAVIWNSSVCHNIWVSHVQIGVG